VTTLHILSDLHLEFSAYLPTVHEADIVILAGDIHLGIKGFSWARENFPNSEIIYVSGNHEFYGFVQADLLDKFHLEADQYNIHFLENDEIILNGIRFLGCTLWTDYTTSIRISQSVAMKEFNSRMADHRLIMKPDGNNILVPFSTRDAWRIHKDSVSWLTKKLYDESFDGKTVVITHHGPSLLCKHKKYGHSELSGGFYSDLPNLIEKADLWVYGHTHSNLDIEIKNTRLISNQRGYPHENGAELDEFNANLIINL